VQVRQVLGIPVCIEKERKYLVEVTGEVMNGVDSQIYQTYLQSATGEEVRVRRRGNGHDWVYFYTHKETGNKEERVETERQISQDEYTHLIQSADPQSNTIQKIRKCFVYEHIYFELDTFISPSPGLQLLEIEGNYQPETIQFPPFLRVLEDVTGNEKYYNQSIARKEKDG
jgi:CYTH domain-containing protein